VKNDEIFTSFEGFSLLSTLLLFHLFNSSLSFMTRSSANAAWIAMLPGSLFAVGLFFLYYLLYRMFPGCDLMEICKRIFGNLGGRLVCLALFVFFCMIAVTNLMESVEILTTNTYAHIRPILLALSFLAVAYIVAVYPVKGLARITSVSILIFAAAILLILFFSGSQYEPAYLTPILGNGLESIARTSVSQLTLYDGLLVAGVFLCSFGEPRFFRKSGLKAVLFSAATFFLCTLCYCMASPYPTLRYKRMGVMELAKSIYINRFFQRMESVYILFVAMGKALMLCIMILALKKLYCHIIDMPRERENTVILPILLGVLALTQYLSNTTVLQRAFGLFMHSYSLVFTLGLLAVLLVGGWLRTRKKKGRGPMRAVCLLLVCGFLLPLLSGCSNISEPDEEMFSIVMGYDKSDSETLRITVKVLSEDKQSAGGAGGGEFEGQEGDQSSAPPENVFTVDAPCNLPAADLINTVLPKHLSMLHVKMLVISEELAREDIDLLITPFLLYNEIKPSISVIICRETAQEFISSKGSELIPFLPMETEMVMKKNKGSASYLARTMGEVYHDYAGGYGDALIMYGGLTHSGTNAYKEVQEESGRQEPGQDKKTPLEIEMAMGNVESPEHTPQGEEKQPSDSVFYDDPTVGYLDGYYPGDVPIHTTVEPQIAGMAVMRGTRMVGALNTHEAAMYMIADGSFPGAVLAVRDPYIENYYVVYNAHSPRKNKVKTSIDENGVAHIDVECFLQAQISIVHNSRRDYREGEEAVLLRQYTERYLQEEIEKLLRKAQTGYESDILRLGRYVAGSFLTIEEWENYDWRSRYKDAEINIRVNLRMM